MQYVLNLVLLILFNLRAILCITSDNMSPGLYFIRPKTNYWKTVDCQTGGDVQIYDNKFNANQYFEVIKVGSSYQIRCTRDGEGFGYWAIEDGFWGGKFVDWDQHPNDANKIDFSCQPANDPDQCHMIWSSTIDYYIGVNNLDNQEELSADNHHNSWWTLFPLPDKTGKYRFKNVGNGKYMDCGGSPVTTMSSSPVYSTQIFEVGFNYQKAAYSIKCTNNGKYFDISGGSTANGANLITYKWHGDDNQRYIFKPSTKTGSSWNYMIAAKHSGKFLSAGTIIEQYSYGANANGKDYQRWLLYAV
eukprot:130133_1